MPAVGPVRHGAHRQALQRTGAVECCHDAGQVLLLGDGITAHAEPQASLFGRPVVLQRARHLPGEIVERPPAAAGLTDDERDQPTVPLLQ